MTKRTFGYLATAGAFAGTLLLASPAEAGKIKTRAVNQQDRIAQGVKSGELTPRETARVESKEAHLNQEVRDMRAVNGGTLTGKERAAVNQQQNTLSRDIYKQKHDAQTDPH
jgi:hypothetical protein